MKSKKKSIFEEIVLIVSILIVAGLGALFVGLGKTWFDNLTRPTEWIPDFVIPIAWSIIYISFGVILSLWLKKSTLPKSVFVLLIINGILNILWCLLFFTLNKLLLGNIFIIVNTIFAFTLIFEIGKNQKTYSYILSIYPIWCSIATTLNLALWILN